MLAGSMYQYVLGTVRALGTMVIMVYASNGGVLAREIASDAGVIEVTVEFKPILVIFLVMFLLVTFKNILIAVDLLY
jgi:hypothetical protein